MTRRLQKWNLRVLCFRNEPYQSRAIKGLSLFSGWSNSPINQLCYSQIRAPGFSGALWLTIVQITKNSTKKDHHLPEN